MAKKLKKGKRKKKPVPGQVVEESDREEESKEEEEKEVTDWHTFCRGDNDSHGVFNTQQEESSSSSSSSVSSSRWQTVEEVATERRNGRVARVDRLVAKPDPEAGAVKEDEEGEEEDSEEDGEASRSSNQNKNGNDKKEEVHTTSNWFEFGKTSPSFPESAEPSDPKERTQFYGRDHVKEESKLEMIERCRQHLHFLRKLHNAGVTRGQPSLESLRRYQWLWLPLVASYATKEKRGGKLIPPSDIAWLWHCHRLDPREYSKYCHATFERCANFLDLSCAGFYDFTDDESDSDAFSKWRERYPSESWKLKAQSSRFDASTEEYSCRKTSAFLFRFDMVQSAAIQAAFLWQVKDITPSRRHVEDYFKFVRLAKHKDADLSLVPTYEIDLVWHTHMTGYSPAQYKQDCIRICEKPLNHDDTLNDRAKGGRLDVSFQKTAWLWKQIYGDAKYKKRGGYRGEPPSTYFRSTYDGLGGESTSPNDGRHDNDNMVDLESQSIVSTPSSGGSDENPTICCDGRCGECCIVCIDCLIDAEEPGCLKCCCIVTFLLAILGLITAGLVLKNQGPRYICGGTPPSGREILERGVPMCLRTSESSGNLCLRSTATESTPPAEYPPPEWCYENTESDGSFYLWWSSSGSAWNMNEEKDDVKSVYRRPTLHQPGRTDVPSGTEEDGTQWRVWNDAFLEWHPESVTISACPDSVASYDSTSDYTLPSECFVEPFGEILLGVGVVLLVVIIYCYGGIAGGGIDGGGGGDGDGDGGGGGCGGD